MSMQQQVKSDNLIWIDLEMTGLDTSRDYIIEIATLVTDVDLNVLAQGPIFAIRQPDEILERMDKWNTRQHKASGLVERVKLSQILEKEAESETLLFIKEYVKPKKSPMCGNSVCQDRRFLSRFMPELEQYFHYRNLDVSTLKELALRWKPEIAANFKKDSQHIALQDILDSIAELRYYRQHFLTL